MAETQPRTAPPSLPAPKRDTPEATEARLRDRKRELDPRRLT